MKNIDLKFLIIFIGLILSAGCKNTSNPENKDITMRNYCTEIGRFDLLFYDDEVSGTYALLPKKSLGAVWGTLQDHEMKGRWIDDDGTGDIIIKFNSDFTHFSTSYRSDEDPEKWYTDSWNGHLRPDLNSSFTVKDKKYQCE